LEAQLAEPFTINLTVGAEADLQWFVAYARRVILDGIELHLRNQPTTGTRRVKTLRPNAIAGWELRLGDYRVLYDVDESSRTVTVLVIGEKQGNRLSVQGQEYADHESNRPERGADES
jgi:mRNA-degrading endonuclease RelE of RelBE toxin-antitoxin system